ncbi:DUF2345 domain-containing protein, partial [Aromatoleum petrolei]
SAPRIEYSAPAGIAQLTPQDLILAAGEHLVTASGDAQLVSQGNHAMAIAHGLALFTIGKAPGGQKPNTETGIHLHAASGRVSVHSQSGRLSAAADKRVTVASTNAALSASAKMHILATAQGAYLRIEGGNIQLHAPGAVKLKASQKVLTGPASIETAEHAAKVDELRLKRDMEIRYLDADGQPAAGEQIALSFNDGSSKAATLDATGKTILRNVPLGPFNGRQPRRRT